MSSENYHHIPAAVTLYASVILPIAIPKLYTYAIPIELQETVQFGMRVEVEFGKSKRYAALVVEINEDPPIAYRPKPLLSLIDEQPIISAIQYKLWQWMAEYYACTLGEVMNTALPGSLKLSSETIVTLSPIYDPNYQGLSDSEFLICEALLNQKELTVDKIRKILDKETKAAVYPVVNRLLKKKVIYLKEELQVKYKPKEVVCVRLTKTYIDHPELLQEAFDILKRSERQVETLMAYIGMARQKKMVKRSELCKKANVDSSVIKAMEKKEVLETYTREISRIGSYSEEVMDKSTLSEQQQRALAELKTQLKDRNVALLHGVTGSGKTRVYIELIQQVIDTGGQVLYLLPEIALTTQIVSRVQKIFGDQIGVFHSRLNSSERVEMWHLVKKGKPIVMGVRSSLLLPYNNLQLIIVDEEHDTSYKQSDPAPRYNARDTAIYLSHLYPSSKVILGTATPALETYFNAIRKKYALVNMPERFGGIQMPEMVLVDALAEFKNGKLQSHFTSVLLAELTKALKRGEQAILFQNRRGYSPTIFCQNCGWNQDCKNCDVSLTYHKFTEDIRCHYCGYHEKVPTTCPSCGGYEFTTRGFGTEKIEDELKVLLPEARVARMDFDTVKGKYALGRLIHQFEDQQIDILVGTQMVTKGLDFENVGIVGVLSADHLLKFPDFRSAERTFQMITQVSGRAGRKHKRGKVIIQAFNTSHPVIKEIITNNYQGFFQRELEERQAFNYPPYYRIIEVKLKHAKPQVLNEATRFYTHILREKLGKRVNGPAVPGIPRIRGRYILVLMIKLEKDATKMAKVKEIMRTAAQVTKAQKGFSSVRINIDVDPQ